MGFSWIFPQVWSYSLFLQIMNHTPKNSLLKYINKKNLIFRSKIDSVFGVFCSLYNLHENLIKTPMRKVRDAVNINPTNICFTDDLDYFEVIMMLDKFFFQKTKFQDLMRKRTNLPFSSFIFASAKKFYTQIPFKEINAQKKYRDLVDSENNMNTFLEANYDYSIEKKVDEISQEDDFLQKILFKKFNQLDIFWNFKRKWLTI